MNRFERRRAAASGNKNKSAAIPMPAAFRGAVERLRESTRSATDLSVPWELFHDELATAPGFNMVGVQAENSKLQRVGAEVMQRVVPGCRAGALLLLHFGDFWHGMFETSSGPVVLYYFEREDLGLLGFTGNPDGRNHLVRFSVFELNDAHSVDTTHRGQA
jgi:hypothetical protein